MRDFAGPLARLIDELKRLPGIGQKSAQRIAFHLERAPREDAERLAAALLEVKDKIGLCSIIGLRPVRTDIDCYLIDRSHFTFLSVFVALRTVIINDNASACLGARAAACSAIDA